MTPAAAIFGVLAVLFAVCALLPVGASAFFGYRAGERLAIGIGAIACEVVDGQVEHEISSHNPPMSVVSMTG